MLRLALPAIEALEGSHSPHCQTLMLSALDLNYLAIYLSIDPAFRRESCRRFAGRSLLRSPEVWFEGKRLGLVGPGRGGQHVLR